MKPYCEIIVKEILPGLRSAVAKELSEEYKLNQSEIARLLGVSQASISQYLRDIRGRKTIIENNQVQEEVKKLCQKIHEKRIPTEQLVAEFCGICSTIRSGELICPMHKSIYKMDKCKACLSQNDHSD